MADEKVYWEGKCQKIIFLKQDYRQFMPGIGGIVFGIVAWNLTGGMVPCYDRFFYSLLAISIFYVLVGEFLIRYYYTKNVYYRIKADRIEIIMKIFRRNYVRTYMIDDITVISKVHYNGKLGSIHFGDAENKYWQQPPGKYTEMRTPYVSGSGLLRRSNKECSGILYGLENVDEVYNLLMTLKQPDYLKKDADVYKISGKDKNCMGIKIVKLFAQLGVINVLLFFIMRVIDVGYTEKVIAFMIAVFLDYHFALKLLFFARAMDMEAMQIKSRFEDLIFIASTLADLKGQDEKILIKKEKYNITKKHKKDEEPETRQEFIEKYKKLLHKNKLHKRWFVYVNPENDVIKMIHINKNGVVDILFREMEREQINKLVGRI